MEETPRWIGAHSVNCAVCDTLVDERDCAPSADGDVCPECQVLDAIESERTD